MSGKSKYPASELLGIWKATLITAVKVSPAVVNIIVKPGMLILVTRFY